MGKSSSRMLSNGHTESDFSAQLASKTVIVTGGAGGIGEAAARVFNKHGANVVIADIPSSAELAEKAIATFPQPENASFVPVDILDWKQMTHLFRSTVERYGSLDTVVANAGIMEKTETLDIDSTDANGNLLESTGAFKVIDVNVKGTLNTLRLAMHHMKSSTGESTGRKSIVLVASTSGYFGGTGVSAYVASKHAIIGLLRSSHVAAKKHGITVTGISPFFTTTNITAKAGKQWEADGLKPNTPEDVGLAIAQSSVEAESGTCTLEVAGPYRKEMEQSRNQIMSQWVGQDIWDFFQKAFRIISGSGGYNLPNVNST